MLPGVSHYQKRAVRSDNHDRILGRDPPKDSIVVITSNCTLLVLVRSRGKLGRKRKNPYDLKQLRHQAGNDDGASHVYAAQCIGAEDHANLFHVLVYQVRTGGW